MFAGFPLLAIPVLAYNLLAFFGPKSNGALPGRLIQPTTQVHMSSGAAWSPTLADLILALAIGAVVVDLVKMFAAGKDEPTQHIWSALVLFICSLEFLMLPEFATSTFALITLMALLCVLASLILTTLPRARTEHRFRSGQ